MIIGLVKYLLKKKEELYQRIKLITQTQHRYDSDLFDIYLLYLNTTMTQDYKGIIETYLYTFRDMFFNEIT